MKIINASNMTIEDLKRLRFLNSEIEAVKQEIENMHNTYRSPAFERIGSSPISPGDPTSEAVSKIIGLQKKYNRMLSDMADQRDRINSWLIDLDDSEIKSIIRWHYINGKSWKETSSLVYGSNSYPFNARKRIYRYFGIEK